MSMQFDAIAPRFGLGAIDQISFVTHSVDDAVPRFTAMFGGPFFVVDVPDMAVRVFGQDTSVSLRLGFGRTGGHGDIEVELVEVTAGHYPTVPWLAEHGEGLHHVRYPVADLARTRDEMVAEAFEITLEGETSGIMFCYLRSPLLNGMTIELTQHRAA